MARLANAGGQSVPFYVGFAAALGLTITITEFTGSDALASTWRVTVTAGGTVSIADADSRADDFLSVLTPPALVLKCEFKRLQPAHGLLLWSFL